VGELFDGFEGISDGGGFGKITVIDKLGTGRFRWRSALCCVDGLDHGDKIRGGVMGGNFGEGWFVGKISEGGMGVDAGSVPLFAQRLRAVPSGCLQQAISFHSTVGKFDRIKRIGPSFELQFSFGDDGGAAREIEPHHGQQAGLPPKAEQASALYGALRPLVPPT